MAGLVVRHNIEVAHRITTFEGKCQNIHGHSMWVELHVQGRIDENGLVQGIEFGALKRAFRGYLDLAYDHQCLLWENDPILQVSEIPGVAILSLPPTTENIAKLIYDVFIQDWPISKIKVQETHVNGAVYP